MTKFKPYIRFFIIGITLFFLINAIAKNWAEIININFTSHSWINIAIALSLNVLGYIWSGYIWSVILKSLNQPVNSLLMIKIYLKTNIAKYIPGNIWHFTGRIMGVKDAGGSIVAATISTLLEILLMISAALFIAFLGIKTQYIILQIIALMLILIVIHPRCLNPLLKIAKKIKFKQENNEHNEELKIDKYPFLILLGEIIFLILRGMGFIVVLMSVKSVNVEQIPLILSSFSISWLLGLIVPGAPGGMGIFELSAIALLSQQFAPGIIIPVVALFRLITIISELILAISAATINK
ncbi:MAG TPA: lysylphosphatidylglycerol synthase domain-containing protein [Allocoleopsis sp.]